jgi:phage-related protein
MDANWQFLCRAKRVALGFAELEKARVNYSEKLADIFKQITEAKASIAGRRRHFRQLEERVKNVGQQFY